MSRSATRARRNKATRRLKPPKVTPFAELTIGTAIATSRGRLRTVAGGCEHTRNVERTHPQPPDPQSETGTLATHSGKRNHQITLNAFKMQGCEPGNVVFSWHWFAEQNRERKQNKERKQTHQGTSKCRPLVPI